LESSSESGDDSPVRRIQITRATSEHYDKYIARLGHTLRSGKRKRSKKEMISEISVGRKKTKLDETARTLLDITTKLEEKNRRKKEIEEDEQNEEYSSE
jgi:hypothetical protein